MTGRMIPFVRMNGIGNEILIADARGTELRVTREAACALARPGALPFDQIMEVSQAGGPGRDFDLRILNSDGSPAQACGNGTRCVVLWLHSQDGKNAYRFHTAGGEIAAELDNAGIVTVDMGSPRFGWADIPLAEEFDDTRGIELQIGPIDAPVLHTPSVVSMGNPHAVFWVANELSDYELDRFGPLLEHHPVFPERANITIARVLSARHIEIRTWERGAGLTKACGSAACATLVCAARKGIADRRATISLPGGELEIEWTEDDRVLMRGPASFEFSGMLDPVTGQYEQDAVREGAS